MGYHHVVNVIEVVRGFGVGGAEKILVERLEDAPHWYNFHILNTKSKLDSFQMSEGLLRRQTRLQYTFYGFRDAFSLIKNAQLIVVRTPIDAIMFSALSYIPQLGKFILVFEAHSQFVTSSRVLEPFLRRIFVTLTRRVSLRIAVSNKVRQGPLCKNSPKTVVHYFGSKSEVTPQTHSNFVGIAFVGTLKEIKRPLWFADRIFNISNELRMYSAQVHYFGYGPLFEDLRNYVFQLGIQDICFLWGKVEQIPHHLRAFDILASTSISEGTPRVIVEAKMLGLRVLTTKSGAEELLEDNDISVAVNDELTFESALIGLVASAKQFRQQRYREARRYGWLDLLERNRVFYELISSVSRT